VLGHIEIPATPRLFDNLGQGFIPVERFREILQEVDDTFTDEELDGIIDEVIE
jgi:Ca2+-binding EF-hand superfamily protein